MWAQPIKGQQERAVKSGHWIFSLCRVHTLQKTLHIPESCSPVSMCASRMGRLSNELCKPWSYSSAFFFSVSPHLPICGWVILQWRVSFMGWRQASTSKLQCVIGVRCKWIEGASWEEGESGNPRQKAKVHTSHSHWWVLTTEHIAGQFQQPWTWQTE